jgi:N-methylhydantoinase A
MRYAGWAFDLQVRLSPADRRQPEVQALEESFHRAHEKIYSFRDPDSRVEITTERLRVIGTILPIDLPRLASDGPAAATIGQRETFLNGVYQQAHVFQREQLRRDDVVNGPGIIEQEDTTTIILPGWSARIDHIGNIVITRAA